MNFRLGTILIGAIGAGLLPAKVYATDHNEPNLISGFYSDRVGSGADVYGLFGYPTDDGSMLNVILTLAPAPETGTFDGNTVDRVFFAEGEVPGFISPKDPKEKLEAAFNGDAAKALVKLRSDVSKIAEGFGPDGRNLKFSQTVIPEIRASFSKDGSKVYLQFFNFPKSGGGNLPMFGTVIPSNGKTREIGDKQNPALNIVKFEGMTLFAGGRDDPFFSDIAGFFRSINFAAALKPEDNDKFTWQNATLSYKASRDDKEQDPRPKGLIRLDPITKKRTKEVVYNGYDWRLGNNVNAICLQIPINMLVRDPKNHRVVYTWAESYLTKSAYQAITAEASK